MTANNRNRTEETADAVENATNKNDAKAALGFPIVGIGASAGGLAAFEKFFLPCLLILAATCLLFWCSIWRRTTRAFSLS